MVAEIRRSVKTGIMDGNREEVRHMTFDKPVVFQYINHNEVMC
jgi:hypothetical protein